MKSTYVIIISISILMLLFLLLFVQLFMLLGAFNPGSAFFCFEYFFIYIFIYIFFMTSDHVLNVNLKFFNDTFLPSICVITTVPRWFRTDDLRIFSFS